MLATEDPGGVQHAHLDHLGTIRLWTDVTGAVRTSLTYSAFGEEIGDNATGRDHQFTGHERDRLRSGGCSGTEEVDNQTIETGGTYEGCDELSSTNTTVTSSEEVRFRAGESIRLSDFAVVSGAVFAAEINANLSSDLQDLDYMHARYCSPVLGRFLSTDRARSFDPTAPQSWNRYSYVSNNPLSYVDPDGRSKRRVHVAHTRMVLASQGFSASAINTVALANIRSDSFPKRFHLPNHAVSLFLSDSASNRRGAQFARRKLRGAISAANRGNLQRALKKLGRALHAAEDVVAHRGVGNLAATAADGLAGGGRLTTHRIQDESLNVTDTSDPMTGVVVGPPLRPQDSAEIHAALQALVEEFLAALSEEDRKRVQQLLPPPK